MVAMLPTVKHDVAVGHAVFVADIAGVGTAPPPDDAVDDELELLHDAARTDSATIANVRRARAVGLSCTVLPLVALVAGTRARPALFPCPSPPGTPGGDVQTRTRSRQATPPPRRLPRCLPPPILAPGSSPLDPRASPRCGAVARRSGGHEGRRTLLRTLSRKRTTEATVWAARTEGSTSNACWVPGSSA